MSPIRGWFQEVSNKRKGRTSPKRKARPALESLEDRVVLYAASGNAWLNPAVITVSFMPDGTNLGGGVSNMFATFNANPALNGKWQNQILQGLQLWAQQTNINFVVVPDNGTPAGMGANEEGDPGFGDIRIGGDNFGAGNSALALTYQPPQVNNFSIAGDITFNTAQTFNVGSTYDLMTVTAHETGHALGLDHSTVSSSAEMYPTYTGKKSLSADDIAGIRSIYSAGAARSADVYNAANALGDSTFAVAANLNTAINGASSALIPNVDVTRAGQVEYYTFTAPAGATTLNVSVQSAGLSLLAPKVTIYAANQTTVLATANGLGQYGTTLTVTVPSITAGQQFYVKVQGADSTANGTGRYALGLSFDGSAPPTEATPILTIPDGGIFRTGGGSMSVVNPVLNSILNGITLNLQLAIAGADSDFLVVGTATITSVKGEATGSATAGLTKSPRFSLTGTAPAGETVLVYRGSTAIGTAKANSEGNWSFRIPGEGLANGTYQFKAVAVLSDGEVSPPSGLFAVTVDTVAPAAPTIQSASYTTVIGVAEADSTVKLYLDGHHKPVGTAKVDSHGKWSITLPTGLALTTHTRVFAVATDAAGNTSKHSKHARLSSAHSGLRP